MSASSWRRSQQTGASGRLGSGGAGPRSLLQGSVQPTRGSHLSVVRRRPTGRGLFGALTEAATPEPQALLPELWQRRYAQVALLEPPVIAPQPLLLRLQSRFTCSIRSRFNRLHVAPPSVLLGIVLRRQRRGPVARKPSPSIARCVRRGSNRQPDRADGQRRGLHRADAGCIGARIHGRRPVSRGRASAFPSILRQTRADFAFERAPLTVRPLSARWEGDREVDLADSWLEQIEPSLRHLSKRGCPATYPFGECWKGCGYRTVARFSFGEPLPRY